MIIHGNYVGHPFADPRKGMTMAGAIDMNGQQLSGLAAPVNDGDAVNKGYVDTNKLDKAYVVNNLTTTEAGRAADARTVKTLNDNKVEKSSVVNNFTTTASGYVADARALKTLDEKFNMDLLWKNESPTSTFANQNITIDATGYNLMVIRYRLCAADGYDVYDTAICVKGQRGWMSTSMGSSGQAGVYTYAIWRQWAVNSNGLVVFYDCYKNNKTTNAPEMDNDWVIPYQIYGMKGKIKT